MARRRRRPGSTQQPGRDAFSPSLTRSVARVDPLDDLLSAPYFPRRPYSPLPELLADLRAFEDRRTWHPDPVEPARSVFAPAGARIGVHPEKRSRGRSRPLLWPSPQVTFRDAPGVAICARRQTRREVIHATGQAGGRVARPTRNAYTEVTCKPRRK